MISDFGELEIEDNYRDREERMRSAFIKSKTDYAKEQIFLEPMANIYYHDRRRSNHLHRYFSGILP